MSGSLRRTNGEGTLTELPNGSWQAKIQIDGVRKSHVEKTRKEAFAWLNDMRKLKEQGATSRGMLTPFADVVKSWWEYTKPSKGESTKDQYQRYIDAYILPKLGKLRVGDIKMDHVEDLISWMRKLGKRDRTIAITHTVLNQAFKYAYQKGMIGFNPVLMVKAPRKKKKVTSFFDETQANQFLVLMQGNRYEAAFRLAVYTGMRQSELLGLKWSDIDWNTGKISIQRQLRRSFQRYGRDDYFGPLKTEKGYRKVKVLKRSLEILAEHWEKQQQEKARCPNWEENNLIFPTQTGKPTSQRNLYRSFIAHLGHTNLPNIRFHDLRHTAATILLGHNLPVLEASTILGHSKPSVTSDIYGHVLPGYEDRAADIMENALESYQLDLPADQETVHKLSTT